MLSLLLAVCVAPLNFPGEFDGPVCTPTAQEEACRCSECITWDAVANASRYEITRRTVSTGFEIHAGTVEASRWTDDDGVEHGYLPTQWCFAKDASFPRDDVLYEYRVRACNSTGCSDEWSNPVRYRAAPYACFDNGREVQCYPGDPVVRP